MVMIGPEIIRATMSKERVYGSGDNARIWQYHSRSDYHSKVAAVALMIDLLQESEELRDDVDAGKVGFDVNPKMRDGTNREKTLDMRFGRIDDALPLRRSRSLVRLIEDYDMELTKAQWQIVHGLPHVKEALSKQELVVLENKACMTAFSKAAPRLRNELEGAVEAVNRTDRRAVAGGLVLINAAETFVSPVLRDNGYVEREQRRVSHHMQPEDAFRSIQKLQNIRPRETVDDLGFDALGIVVVAAQNDGSPWTLVDDPAFGAPQPQDVWHYTKVVQKLARLYRIRFS
jgi:hypothetical protein